MVSEIASPAAPQPKTKQGKKSRKPEDSAAPASDVAPSTGHAKRVPKPDRIAYNQQIEDLTRETDAVKAKIDELKEAIANLGTNDKKQQEKLALNEQIEAVKAEQAKFNESKNAILEQLKHSQDVVKRKIDEIKNARDKMSFRSVTEIDRRIAEIDAQVSSGKLSLPEEKRLLQDITALRKQRKAMDSLAPQESSIDVDKKKADELRKQLDALEPEGKKFKKRLDELYAQLRESQAERSDFNGKLKALRNERDELSKKMSDLLTKRKELYNKFKKEREEYDIFWKEEKARKDLEYKKMREEQNKQKKLEAVRRALEQAELPAFEDEILLCTNLTQLLHGYVSHKENEPPVTEAAPEKKSEATTVVRDALPKGVAAATVLKSKADRFEDELLFGGTLAKKKAHKTTKEKEKDFKFDFSVVDQFLKLKIDVPTKPAEIPKTIQALEEKKKYFVENQDRVTKENVEKAKKMEEEVLKSFENPETVEEKESVAVVEETPVA